MSSPCPIVVHIHHDRTAVTVPGAADAHPTDAEHPTAVAHAVGRTLSERDFYVGLELDHLAERAEALADLHCTDLMSERFPTLRAMMLDGGAELDDLEVDPGDADDLAADLAAHEREQEIAAAWLSLKATAAAYVAERRAARASEVQP